MIDATSKWYSLRKIRAQNNSNRIRGTVVYIQPLKLQASLRAHDLARKYKLVDVGHRFRKVSVLATTSVKFYPKKLEWTSNAD